jgi:hypothetical protein
MNPSLPAPHAAFLDGALPVLATDERIVGIAAGGSYALDAVDEFSDLDLVIAIEPFAHENVLAEAQMTAATLGSLLVAFTGEHVGEPRLLICLYQVGESLVHVDLKFVALPDVAKRVEDPVVLWERDGRMTDALATGVARFPDPDPQWIEDRIWTWVHYVAAKIGRGELLEAVDSLAFVRGLALGPLALASRRARPTGVRKLERAVPELASRFARTVASCDRRACLAALEEAITLYRDLRTEMALDDLHRHDAAEAAAVAYVSEIASRHPDAGVGRQER